MNRRVIPTGAVAVLAAALLAPPAAAQTNGFVLQCLSARTSGQGCVTRGQEAMPTSLFRDPAGLVAFERPTLEVNAAPFVPGLTFENAVNARVDGTRHVFPLGSVAYVGPRLGKLAWAVGVEPIGGFGSDFELEHVLLSGPDGELVDYESMFAAAKLGPAVAYELAPGLSVGASVSLVYGTIRDFRMPFTMPPSAAAGLAGIPQLDAAVYGPLFQEFTELTAYGDSEDYDGFTWTADVGVRYQAESGFTVAASWAPERALDVDGGVAEIDMSAQFGQMMAAMVMARAQAYGETPEAAQAAVMSQLTAAGLDLGAGMVATYDAATTITLPMTVGAGVGLPVTPALRLAAEVEWRQWSEAENVMPFRLTEGENPNINLMLNGDPSDGRFTYPFPLEWEDTWSGKVGAEYALASGHVLRAGYLQGQNPVPDRTVFITFPAISTRAITAGATLQVAGFPVDVSYVYALEEELEGCGDDHLMGSEYLNSRTTMDQNVFTIGTVVSF
jgi:long-subunit fatty acid transport protein